MLIKYQAILTVEAALKAVEQDGDALRYVLRLDLFRSIAARLRIKVSDPEGAA